MITKLKADQHPKVIGLYKIVQPIEYSLESDICSIGRSMICQVVVPLKTVSSLHAKIERNGSYYMLYDTDSTNGTFVNGQQVREPYLLKDQDLIGLSVNVALLRFEIEDPDLFVRLRYDRQAMTFFLNEKPVDLTSPQFYLLDHLYQHAGRVCTWESCAEAIWGQDYDPDLDAPILDRVINGLRGRLRKVEATAKLIETREDLGYVLNLQPRP